MRFFRILVIILLFIVPLKAYSHHRADLPLIKIAIINSYTYNHPCTAPQVEGFKKFLKKIEDRYRFEIISFDMDTKIKNITKNEIEDISSIIINKVKKYNPFIIFTTDDNACRYIALKLSKKYPVVSSGLNKFPKDYIRDFRLRKNKYEIVFIAEYTNLDKLWFLFNQVGYIPMDFYIITEPPNNMSTTNFYMFKNFSNELIKKHYRYKVITVKNTIQLKSNLLKLNTLDKQVVIIPVIQRLRNIKGRFIDKLYISNYIYRYNKKHLDVGCNEIFCKYGLGICIGPSFYNMGFLAGKQVSEYIDKCKFDNLSVIYPKMILVLNKKVLEKLKLNIMFNIDNNLYIKGGDEYDLVNKFYDEVILK